MRRLALIVIVGLITLWLSSCAASQPAPEPAKEAEAPAVTEQPAASEPAAEAPTEAAASEEAAPTADAAAATSAEDSAEPVTIVFSNIAETATLDPAIAFSSDGLEFVRNVYEGLLEYVPASTELRPALAESWEVSEDGLTYTFTLRQGVKYHDGADFNAEAAKMGLDRIKEINQGPASLMTDISSIEAVDAQTLKITLSRPNVFFLGVLPKLPLVSPQAIEANKTDADPWANDFFATNGVGTGPYKFDSWNKGSQIVMVKNTGYWQEWLPYTADRVILRVDADISTALQLLGQGQIDMLGAVGPDDSIAAKDLPGVKLIEQPQFQVSILTLNTNNKPLDNVKVREAIKYAFDYQAFADFFQGLGETPTGPLPKNAEGVDPSLPVQKQDMEKAKQLLAEAGYPDGGFKLRYLGLKGLSYEEFAGTLLQQNLAELGIELEQILVPWPQMPPTMADKATAPDISYLNQSMFTNDPTFILRTSYFSGNTADKSGYNWSYYVDAEVDKWLDEIPTIQDEQERTEALYNLQQKIVGDVPALYVVTPTLAQPVRENIEGAVYETLDYNYLVRFFYVQKMPQQ
ncbi:MAG: ABC transporter substrate-binding protein [Chloroflexota bacterium]|nr:MAG: ABC transporter substrate-binding protein [Chloroflexota bacterium]